MKTEYYKVTMLFNIWSVTKVLMILVFIMTGLSALFAKDILNSNSVESEISQLHTEILHSIDNNKFDEARELIGQYQELVLSNKNE